MVCSLRERERWAKSNLRPWPRHLNPQLGPPLLPFPIQSNHRSASRARVHPAAHKDNVGPATCRQHLLPPLLPPALFSSEREWQNRNKTRTTVAFIQTLSYLKKRRWAPFGSLLSIISSFLPNLEITKTKLFSRSPPFSVAIFVNFIWLKGKKKKKGERGEREKRERWSNSIFFL